MSMMMGIGTPSSQSSIPRPMSVSFRSVLETSKHPFRSGKSHL
jgi:hypothetical protein